MEFRYSVKSNGENKLVERTYYKKKGDIFYVETTKKEFHIITSYPLDYAWNDDEQHIPLIQFKDIFYGPNIQKICFTNAISAEDRKFIKKALKEYSFERNVSDKGWKLFETSSKIIGESEIKRVPFNQLSLQATEMEISYQNISESQFKNYLENGISSEEYDDISTGGDSGFCETDIKFEVNNEDVNIQKYISKEFRKKDLDEHLIIRFQLPTLVVAHYFKRSYATVDIFEEFDPRKINLKIEKYIFKNGANGYYYSYLPMYGEQDFEFESSGLHNYTDILIIDKKGKVHSIEISEADDESEEE
jgi:hypothetical protein